MNTKKSHYIPKNHYQQSNLIQQKYVHKPQVKHQTFKPSIDDCFCNCLANVFECMYSLFLFYLFPQLKQQL